MSIWKAYTNRINQNCAGPGIVKDIDYWRNNLFAGTIINLLPFCLIALVPGIYFCLITQQYVLASVDIVTTISILLIAFTPGIALLWRKIIFFSFVVLMSCVMMLYVGMAGPGLLYLLAACFFSILIFPTAYSYWPAWIITGICIVFTVAIFYNLIVLPRQNLASAAEWVAVSSNLVFVGFLLAALIPRLFKGLQETLDKEKELKEALRKQQDELQLALNLVQQKNNELEQFAYVASHDLQEPLRMVTSFLSLLATRYEDMIDDNGRKYINFAVDGAERMKTIILNLLDFSRVGRTEENLDLIDLNVMIKDIQMLFQKEIEDKKASITIDPLPTIQSYTAPVRQVFQNLIGNALKYSRQDVLPKIHISVKEINDCWQFEVADNGIGISDEYFEKIFIIFQRLHNKNEFSGTGIGLAITKKIIEMQGGKIWLTSEEGKGSTFYFTIIK